jgi:hypothetical protein
MFKVIIKKRDGNVFGGAEFNTLPEARAYAQEIKDKIADDGLPYFFQEPIEDMIEDVTSIYQQKEINQQARAFLVECDWKRQRHISQKALNIETSLTEEEYLAMEQQAQQARESIIEE